MTGATKHAALPTPTNTITPTQTHTHTALNILDALPLQCALYPLQRRFYYYYNYYYYYYYYYYKASYIVNFKSTLNLRRISRIIEKPCKYV